MHALGVLLSEEGVYEAMVAEAWDRGSSSFLVDGVGKGVRDQGER